MIGQTIDNTYVIRRLLGEGGMGAVYEGEHRVTGRRVAVKVVNAAAAKRAGAIERFTREAKVVGAVETQHIVQIYDAGMDLASGAPYIAMELLAGEDVQQLIRRIGPLAPDLALRIAAQACLGLAKAHATGIVHRDIKPANLYLARRDAGEVIVKLLDFGIAKSMEGDATKEKLTATGSVLGSPSYMSPEQVKGLKTIDARTDVWSLGAVMYEMLTGLVPYHRAETIHQLIMAICAEPPPPLQDLAPWVPPEVVGIVDGAMQHDVQRRFQGAVAMREFIMRLLPNTSWAMHEQMMVPIAPRERTVVAPRAKTSTAVVTATENTGAATAQLSQSSMSHAPAAPGRSLVLPIVAAGCAVALLGAGIAAYALKGRGADAPPAPSVEAAASAPAEPAPTASVAGADEAPSAAPSSAAAAASATAAPAPTAAAAATTAPATTTAVTGKAPAQPGPRVPGKPRDGRSTKFE